MNLFGKIDATQTIISGIVNDYDYFREHVNKVVLQAPCLTPDPSLTSWYNGELKEFLETEEIYELGGPTWYKSAGKIANKLSLSTYRIMVLTGYGGPYQGQSSKLLDHFAQLGRSQRFQKYAPDYWSTADGVETELYDLSVIQDIPVGYFMANGDEYCTQDQAQRSS